MRRKWRIIHGDCVDVMAGMEAESVDAIVTDPPYGLKFMGKGWDDMGHGSSQQAWHYRWAMEALRVLKPGGHLLAFGGTKTYHRLASAVEDAGFEIRDQMQWLYGTGFPKSHNVANAIDKSLGQPNRGSTIASGSKYHATTGKARRPGDNLPKYESRTESGNGWEGWGTALKPAHEPIVVARKPLIGTVATNVLKYGTGGLNVDATRIGYQNDADKSSATPQGKVTSKEIASIGAEPDAGRNHKRIEFDRPEQIGRWPANVIFDEESGAMLDEQSGTSQSRTGTPRASKNPGEGWGMTKTGAEHKDSGDASRFFYCAKASKAERESGLDNWDLVGGLAEAVTVRGNTNPTCQTCKKSKIDRGNGECVCDTSDWAASNTQRRNTHPTVKPIALMAYLVRLVTPPNGVVLDPFVGSGSTGVATVQEGFKFIGIELDADYVSLSKARIKHYWKEDK